jgi:hypothetical protein
MESSPRPHRITIVLALLAAAVSAMGVYITYRSYVLDASKRTDSAGGPSSAVLPSANAATQTQGTEDVTQAAAEPLKIAGYWSANSFHYTIITQSGDRVKLDTYYKPSKSLRITCEGSVAGQSLDLDCEPNPSWQAPEREHYVGHFSGLVQSGGRAIIFTGYPQGYKLQWGIVR